MCKVDFCVSILVSLRMGESFLHIEVRGYVIWDKSLEGME
jgi:hypothetical protein